MRKIALRRVPKDPLSAVYESDDEFWLDNGPMVLAVIRAPKHGLPAPWHQDQVTDLMKALADSNPGKSVVVVRLAEGEDVELWEEAT